MKAFGISRNPFASLGALSEFNRTRDRNLSVDELTAFMKRLEGVPASVKKDALMLCLLLGGQRPTQLLRCGPGDVDLSAGTITLRDPKGKRKQPRLHILPVPKKALAILQRRLDELDHEAPFIFTSYGKAALRTETVSGIVADLSAAMVKAKEARPFELRDIRKTCETRLAALGVSSDVRAMILSHGLGGVQKRHYDFHDYALEMRAALEKWSRHLDGLAAGKSAKVTPIRKSA